MEAAFRARSALKAIYLLVQSKKSRSPKNNDVCGEGDREVIWVDVKDGALRGAFVFIEKLKRAKPGKNPRWGSIWSIRKVAALVLGRRSFGLVRLIIRNSRCRGAAQYQCARADRCREGSRCQENTFSILVKPDPGDIVDKI